MPLGDHPRLGLNTRHRWLIALLIIIATLGYFTFEPIRSALYDPHPRSFALSSYPSPICPASPPTNLRTLSSSETTASSGSEQSQNSTAAIVHDPIPNIVHYIWLLPSGVPSGTQTLTLSFKLFISIYSSHFYLRPTTIYFHTDCPLFIYLAAKSDPSNIWTHRILNLPSLKYHYIVPPTHASNGHAILTLEAKSDFLRTLLLFAMGGLYLDTDALPLRPLSPLLALGSQFSAIVGGNRVLTHRHSGALNCGVMFARPGSGFIGLYAAMQGAVYDGSWGGHATELLTWLARKVGGMPPGGPSGGGGEVLVLGEGALGPVSWEKEGQRRLFVPHAHPHANIDIVKADEGAAPPPLLLPNDGASPSCADLESWLRAREAASFSSSSSSEGDGAEEWLDFSEAWVLHAFDRDRKSFAGTNGWDGEISLPYVLGRRSSYARAVWPAVAAAIESGVIPWGEAVEAGWV